MSKLLAYVARLTEAHRAALSKAAASHGLEAVFCDSREDALREAADAEIILSHDPALPGVAPGLKWMCCAYAGVEPFLPDAAYANPAALLSNSAGAYGVTIAEHIVMVTLELMRRQLDYDQVVARRGWLRTLPIHSIHGSRVTLLGTGDIGRETAARLRAFRPARITGVNRTGHPVDGAFDAVLPLSALDAVLPETDLLIMALPGTRETKGLMDARRLALLPKEAYLVNVGRGSAVDQRALMALMTDGHLSGAALDVFEVEPLSPDDPLWDCPRLRITPHVAGNMTLDYTVDRIVAQFLEDFANYCAGRPLLRQVDREKGY